MVDPLGGDPALGEGPGQYPFFNDHKRGIETMTTKIENTDIEIEDITLIGDDDISVPRVLESITIESGIHYSLVTDDDQPRLDDLKIQVIKEQYSGTFKRAVFVAVVGGLGIATEHDRGYWPIPSFWYKNDDFGQAMDYAMELNLEVFGIAEDDAHTVIGSTMRHGGE
jgi:hypothetical protein